MSVLSRKCKSLSHLKNYVFERCKNILDRVAGSGSGTPQPAWPNLKNKIFFKDFFFLLKISLFDRILIFFDHASFWKKLNLLTEIKCFGSDRLGVCQVGPIPTTEKIKTQKQVR